MPASYFIIGLIIGMLVSLFATILLFAASHQPDPPKLPDKFEQSSRTYRVVGGDE